MKHFLLIFFTLLTAPVFAAEGGVAYVDFERVYRDSKLVKAVSDDINVKFKKRTALLEKADKEIRALREQLQKEALTMSEAKKEDINAQIAASNRSFTRERRALAEDRGLSFQQRRKAVDSELARIIEIIAKEKKYDMVLNPFIALPVPGDRLLTHSILLYANAKADITAEVIKRFDKQANLETTH